MIWVWFFIPWMLIPYYLISDDGDSCLIFTMPTCHCNCFTLVLKFAHLHLMVLRPSLFIFMMLSDVALIGTDHSHLHPCDVDTAIDAALSSRHWAWTPPYWCWDWTTLSLWCWVWHCSVLMTLSQKDFSTFMVLRPSCSTWTGVDCATITLP